MKVVSLPIRDDLEHQGVRAALGDEMELMAAVVCEEAGWHLDLAAASRRS